MTTTATGALTQTALEVVKAQLDAATNSVIDYNQITLSVDAEASQFVLTARSVTGDGVDPVYAGELRRPYEKLDLEALVPEPLFVDASYPLTFNQLRIYLEETYDIILEEGELAKGHTPLTPLLNGDYLDEPLEATLGVAELVVTNKSGRFRSGGRVRFIFAMSNNQHRLQDSYRQTKLMQLADLKFTARSVANLSLFNATRADCAAELFRRHHGVELDTSQIDASVVSLNHYRGKIMFHPRYGSTSPWTGAVELLYEKADIAALCPDYLQINLPYPTTYQALRSFLEQSYGLRLTEGEVSAWDYGNPALTDTDVISQPLIGHAFLDLYVQKASWRWLGRSRIRLQFLQPPNGTVGPRIVSSAPDGVEGVVWAYQTVADGGTPDYTFETFGTPPTAIDASTGQYNGQVTEGFYSWLTVVRDEMGLIGVKRETAEIAAAPSNAPTYGFVRSDDSGYFVSSHTDIPFFNSHDEEEPPP